MAWLLPLNASEMYRKPGRGKLECCVVMSLLFRKVADNRQDDSLATGMRRKRFALFLSLLERVPPPVSILDVGGTQNFWERMGLNEHSRIHVTLLNIQPQQLAHPGFSAMIGDATNMSNIADQAFDVVFSNSVIEHVGDFTQQKRMADEVKRVGRRYFLQTPNYYFPIEPHFLFPGFQWLPVHLRVFLITHFSLGWSRRISDVEQARKLVENTRLLRKRQLLQLFPGATLFEERLFGLVKSFVVYERW
jgi:hypothetical protein